MTAARTLSLWSIPLGLVVLAGCTPSPGTTFPVGPAPKVQVVGDREYDFGVIERGRSGEHGFKVRNDGEAPLTLKVGKTSCKCTIGDVEDGELAPGDETTITLKWEADGDERYFRQSAQIQTNDPLTPIVELVIAGKVVDLVSASPNVVTLSNINPGQDAEAHFVIHSPEFESFEITGVSFRREELGKFFKLSYEKATPSVLDEHNAKGGYECRVKLLPGLPIGQFAQILDIATDLPDASPVEVRLNGSISGELSIMGGGYLSEYGLLPIGQVFRNDGATRTVRLLVGGEHRDVDVTEVSVSHPASLTAEVGAKQNLGNKVSFPITITVPVGAEPVSCLGANAGGFAEVLVRTTHPETPAVRVMVKFSVVER